MSLHNRVAQLTLANAGTEAQLDGPIVIAQGAHGFLVLADARSGHGLYGADHRLQTPAGVDFPAKTRRRITHGVLPSFVPGRVKAGMDSGPGAGSVSDYG